METQSFWKKCSTCKKPIPLGGRYYLCSVSTCNGQRTGYVFCQMTCFESHLPGARHRDAGAIEKIAPMKPDTTHAGSPGDLQSTPIKRIVVPNSSTNASTTMRPGVPEREVLIIASRLKEYITAKSDFNTSSSVMDVLSDFVRLICDRAIDEARADGRRTVMDRDFQFLKDLAR